MSVLSSNLLRTIDLFEELTSDDLEQLSHRLHHRVVRAGEVVCRPEEPCDAMFVVVEGCIELATPNPDGGAGSPVRLDNGDVWGEIALISGEHIACSATALAESRLLELDRDDFDAFVAARPRAMRGILAAVSQRAVQANQRLFAEPPKDTREASAGRVCVVFSPRGGSGKTLVATRLALKLAERMPRRVTLLDLDLLFDNAAFQLELTPPTSIGGLPETQTQVDARTVTSLMSEHSSGLRVVVGASRPEDGERVTSSQVRSLLAALKRQFHVTIVDCDGTFSEPTLAALEIADRVFVVCTPELATLRDLQHCQRVFGQTLHLDRNRVAFVLNHPLPSTGLTRRQFEEALEQKVTLEMDYAGDEATKPTFGRAIDRLADELAPKVPARKGGFGLPWRGHASHAS